MLQKKTVFIDEDDDYAIDHALKKLLSKDEIVKDWGLEELQSFGGYGIPYELNFENFGYVHNEPLGSDFIQYRTINKSCDVILIVQVNKFA